jgi:uncharacterized protein YndB with AHSA1/START domain
MTSVAALVHTLERSIVIEAPRETVFRFFSDPARWATWWGAGSTIDPRVGGALLIRYPDGTEAVGEILQFAPPERLTFTYGYALGTPIAPGSSVVEIVLKPHERGTRLELLHRFGDPAVRDHHVQGWRYQLSLFANLVANDLHANAADTVDRWFAAWSDPDAAARDATVHQVAAPGVRFRDRFSAVAGIDDLRAHLAAVHRFMPGMRLQRDGDVRQCQGMVIADWVARTQDGTERARGTNVFVLDQRSRIESVTGFWT